MGVTIPDRLTILADVAQVVSQSHDLNETLSNVVDLVAKRLDADVCSIYLTDPNMHSLTLCASKGLSEQSIGRVRIGFDEGLVGESAKTQQPIVTAHAQQHPQYRYFPETGEEQFQSLMAVPLVVRGSTIGVLVVQTRDAREYDAGDVELLRTCAQLIAPVVMNARLLSLVAAGEEVQKQVIAKLALTGVIPAPETQLMPARAASIEHRGIAASRGIAIGPVYILEDPLDLEHLAYTPSDSPTHELQDLMLAVAQAREELHEVREEVAQRFSPEFAAVFNTHIQILEDKGFIRRIEVAVDRTGNALEALRDVLNTYRQTFERIEDTYFRERGMDIEDVGRRVMEKLLGVRHQHTPFREGSIVIASNIFPHHFVSLETEKIAGLVSEHGGSTSHGAIFARSLEIPTVFGAAGILQLARSGELAIIDGTSGRVFLSPDEELLTEYRAAQKQYRLMIEHLDALRDQPAKTLDQRRIALTANVGLMHDLRLIEQHGADGVGLFRTELLAIAHRGFPEEEEQTRMYAKVAELMAPRTVTIRTLDLGGDKLLPNYGVTDEENPQLGWRSIRLSLCHEDQFRTQLRAILRASAHGSVRILLPMISSLEELRQAKGIIRETMSELAWEDVTFDENIPVGVMIEVPAAALVAERLAEECDFFSIGTNDLTQYTLAVDRGNEHVAHLYDPLHPAVLILLERTVRAAQAAGIPVSVCGEMAGSPLTAPLLIGLGITELSTVPGAVPAMKEVVRRIRFSDVEKDVQRALAESTGDAVRAIAVARLRKAGLLDHPDLGAWVASVIWNDGEADG